MTKDEKDVEGNGNYIESPKTVSRFLLRKIFLGKLLEPASSDKHGNRDYKYILTLLTAKAGGFSVR